MNGMVKIIQEKSKYKTKLVNSKQFKVIKMTNKTYFSHNIYYTQTNELEMKVPISAIFLGVYTGASKTTDSFWNLKTSVPAKRRYCTIIMYSNVCSLVAVQNWSMQHWMWQWKCLSKQSRLQLHSVISISSFKDVMLLAAILCYYEVKRDQWRTVNYKDVHYQHLTIHYQHLTWQCGTNEGRHVVKSVQVSSVASSCTSLNAAFAKFSTRICITTHTKSKLLRDLVNGTRWADYSFAMNSWTWWKTIATYWTHS